MLKGVIPVKQEFEYKPRFFPIPPDFLDVFQGLGRLVLEEGEGYIGYFNVIATSMGYFYQKEFTMSIEEMVDALTRKLFLYKYKKPVARDYIAKMIEYEVLEARLVLDAITQREDVRYCVPLAQDHYEVLYAEYLSKCLNPSKMDKADKAKIKELEAQNTEHRKEIRRLDKHIVFSNSEMQRVHEQTPSDGALAEKMRKEIVMATERKGELYRQIHANKAVIDQIKTKYGGDLNVDE